MPVCDRCGCETSTIFKVGDVVYNLCPSCAAILDRNMSAFMSQFAANSTIVKGAALILEGLKELYGLETTEDMKSTPYRVARMFAELCSGLKDDPANILSVTYPAPTPPNLIVSKNIDFVSLCRHHLAIILGQVHIGYLPKSKIVGLSKLARLVDCFAKRPQIQEEMTNQIADAIVDYLDPAGVIVFVSAQHGCMSHRGVLKQGAVTETSAVRGVFLHNTAGCKDEFFAMIGGYNG
jgi:GTP cyclohydrolase I